MYESPFAVQSYYGFRQTCSLWVKSRHRSASAQCPLYPQKRTSELSHGMSALCQKQTFGTAKNVELLCCKITKWPDYLPSFQISVESFQFPSNLSHTTTYLLVISFGVGPLVFIRA